MRLLEETQRDALDLGLVLVGDDIPAWDKNLRHYHYILIVSRGSTGEAVQSFDFWGSRKDYEDHDPTRVSAVEVFGCVLDDAISYWSSRDIDDFQANMGYEECSELLRAWNGCKAAAEKLEAVRIDEDAAYTMLDEIREEE